MDDLQLGSISEASHPVEWIRGCRGPGNCNLTYYGPETGYGDLHCENPYLKGDQSVQDSEYAHEALTYAEHHLGRLPVVLFRGEGRTFGFWDPFQQASITAHFMGTWPGVTDLALVSYWVLIAPALVGAIVLRRRRIAIFPLLAFVAIAAVTVLPTIGDVRYRATAEIPLVLLAAVAIDAALRWMQGAPALGSPSDAEPEEWSPPRTVRVDG